MRKLVFLLGILFICSIGYADDYVRQTTWATSDLITASKLNADPDEAARILGDSSDGLITNGNIKSTAAIVESKISFNSSTGHPHDGVTGRLISSESLKTTEHVTTTEFRIGAEADHIAANTWDIAVSSASSKPALRYQGVDTGDGSWQVSNDGVSFYNIPTSDTTPEFKVGEFTRAHDAANGNQIITGIGFTPSMVQFIAAVGSSDEMSIGYDDGTDRGCVYARDGIGTDTWGIESSTCINMAEDASKENAAVVASFDDNGFTLTWTIQDSPSGGTITVEYLAYK